MDDQLLNLALYAVIGVSVLYSAWCAYRRRTRGRRPVRLHGMDVYPGSLAHQAALADEYRMQLAATEAELFVAAEYQRLAPLYDTPAALPADETADH